MAQQDEPARLYNPEKTALYQALLDDTPAGDFPLYTTVKPLIEAGANPNLISKNGTTLLEVVASDSLYSDTDEEGRGISKRREIKLLCSLGANPLQLKSNAAIFHCFTNNDDSVADAVYQACELRAKQPLSALNEVEKNTINYVINQLSWSDEADKRWFKLALQCQLFEKQQQTETIENPKSLSMLILKSPKSANFLKLVQNDRFDVDEVMQKDKDNTFLFRLIRGLSQDVRSNSIENYQSIKLLLENNKDKFKNLGELRFASIPECGVLNLYEFALLATQPELAMYLKDFKNMSLQRSLKLSENAASAMLYSAAYNLDAQDIRTLIKAGADVNRPSPDTDMIPLDVAFSRLEYENTKTGQALSAIKELCAHGAKPQNTDMLANYYKMAIQRNSRELLHLVSTMDISSLKPGVRTGSPTQLLDKLFDKKILRAVANQNVDGLMTQEIINQIATRRNVAQDKVLAHVGDERDAMFSRFLTRIADSYLDSKDMKVAGRSAEKIKLLLSHGLSDKVMFMDGNGVLSEIPLYEYLQITKGDDKLSESTRSKADLLMKEIQKIKHMQNPNINIGSELSMLGELPLPSLPSLPAHPRMLPLQQKANSLA